MDMDVDVPSDLGTKRNEGSGLCGIAGEIQEESTLPWVEKYRPKELSELSQSDNPIITILESLIESNRFPHLLLHGPPGTGKTTTIMACARKIFGPKYKSMILELNASDDRGIDTVRDKIKDFCSTKTIFGTKFKLLILEEADSMTQIAQNSLRRIVEKYSNNVRFALTCNSLGKIIPALQSRCTCFRIAPLGKEVISQCIDNVVSHEGVRMTYDGRRALEKLSRGDMRKALTILQATHISYGIVDEGSVYKCTGSPTPSEIKNIFNWILSEDIETAYNDILSLQFHRSLALQDIMSGIHDMLLYVKLPPEMYIHVLRKFAEIEENISRGASPEIQLCALIAAFKIGGDLSACLLK